MTLSACQTVTSIGNEPLDTLDNPTIKTYHAYQIALKNYPHHHMVFAVDPERGRSVWLGRKKQLGVGFATEEAIKNCRKTDASINCKILDINGQIVWKGIDEKLKQKLASLPDIPLILDKSKYSEAERRITPMQVKRYQDYIARKLPHDSSAFYISVDGWSTGVAFNTGRGKQSRDNVLRDAEVRCEVNSAGSKCQLFAVNGKPVNKAARNAISRF